jgi:hypothetical protein
MRNRALHDALREFALESAALLTDDQRSGVELRFDVTEESGRRGPSLYRYRPLTAEYIEERWQRLRELPSCASAADALGAGAASYLRIRGLRGEQAEPALQAMLQRLYEDATSFAFPEERFERVYEEVERTLYQGTVSATVLAPLHGVAIESARVDLGEGLALVRGDAADAPPEAVWSEDDGEPAVLCALERDVDSDDPFPALEAGERFRRLVSGLRLFKAGGLTLGGVGFTRAAEGRWTPIELGGTGGARGEPWLLCADEEGELREFLGAVDGQSPSGSVGWALARFEMGCSRPRPAEALSDYLLALRALLDTTSDTGRAGLSLRLAALCAEEGERRAAQRRVELAQSLERFLMRGGQGDLDAVIGAESPAELIEELEGHLRALLRDVTCGYLEQDLKAVADDILLDTPEALPVQTEVETVAAGSVRARRMAGWRPREEPADGAEAAPAEDGDEEEEDRQLEGVTPSADWLDEDPESYSAPV